MFLNFAVERIEIFLHFFLNVRRKFFGKIFECIFSLFSQTVIRAVGLRRHFHKICLNQFGNGLLKLKIIGIFPIQDKIGDLRVREIPFGILQHV